MTIRVTYGDVSDFAKMGLLAGKSQASVRREEQRFQQELRAQSDQAAQNRLQITLQNQREMQEFTAYMSTQAQQRSQAWEFEKVEMSARNRFELQEASFAAKFQVAEMEQLKKTQETQLKIAAINKSREDLGDKVANDLILALETGLSPRDIRGKEESYVERLVREAMGRQGETAEEEITPTVEKVPSREKISYLRQAATNKNIAPEDREKIKEAIDRGTPDQVDQIIAALEDVQGITNLEEFSAERRGAVRKIVGIGIKSLSPLGAGFQLFKARGEIKKAREKKQLEAARFSDRPASALMWVLQSRNISEVDKILATKALRGNDPENMIRVKREILERVRAAVR